MALFTQMLATPEGLEHLRAILRYLLWIGDEPVHEAVEQVLQLTARGLHVDSAARQRILSCSDVATLDRWLTRALHATSLSEVLDDVAQ